MNFHQQIKDSEIGIVYKAGALVEMRIFRVSILKNNQNFR